MSLNYVSAENAVGSIKSGERIFIHGGAATPELLIEALVKRHKDLDHIEIVHLHTEGDAQYSHPDYKNSFTVNSFFLGENLRRHDDDSNINYVPIFLSEIPSLFRKGYMKLDTAIVQVSEPDSHGYCSLGVSVDIAKAATDSAQKIIALVNRQMPRSHGDSQIHFSRFHSAVYTDTKLYEAKIKKPGEIETAIGKNIASLIEDGATLQLGIGAIPGAVCAQLSNHRNLGLHTEMFNDSVLPLIESGVINGSLKKKHRGKVVSAFAIGTQKLYDFIHDNPTVAMLDAGYVNDTAVIRQNPKVMAINSAIEIDLTGQVCADSIGHKIFSGVGGQMDFMRGASLSENGKAIIALPSSTRDGVSKLVYTLNPGAGVVTTRAHVQYVVTEYGIAQLYGKNLRERARELIRIAHPAHRERLEFECGLKRISSQIK